MHNPRSIEYEEYMAAYLIKIGYLMGYNVIFTDQNEDAEESGSGDAEEDESSVSGNTRSKHYLETLGLRCLAKGKFVFLRIGCPPNVRIGCTHSDVRIVTYTHSDMYA